MKRTFRKGLQKGGVAKKKAKPIRANRNKWTKKKGRWEPVK